MSPYWPRKNQSKRWSSYSYILVQVKHCNLLSTYQTWLWKFAFIIDSLCFNVIHTRTSVLPIYRICFTNSNRVRPIVSQIIMQYCPLIGTATQSFVIHHSNAFMYDACNIGKNEINLEQAKQWKTIFRITFTCLRALTYIVNICQDKRCISSTWESTASIAF